MVSKESYEQRWNLHVNELTRLGWYLEAEDQDKLEDIREDLKVLVETAAENKEREDEDGVVEANREVSGL
jgi:hypothetical protein